jgi:hypothetical protein
MSVNAMAARNGIKADIESGMINGEPIPVWAIESMKKVLDMYNGYIRKQQHKKAVLILRIELNILDSIYSTSAAICEKTGTREWDKTDTPPTTITLETIRTSAAIFRRVGICA